MDIETVLGDFAAVAPNAAERATFFSTLASNSELQTAILQSLIVTDPEGSARSKHAVAAMPEALSMLLAWYRSLTEVAEPGTAPRHWFVLQFVPFVIEANFVLRSGVGGSNRKICKTIDTFLLSLYNSEVADRAGAPHEAQIRLPNLMQSSLYHDCSRIDLDSGVVSNNAAQTPAAANSGLQLTLRLYKQATRITGQNRMAVSEALLRAFNADIGELNKHSLEQFIRCCQRMLHRGHTGSGHKQAVPRIVLSGDVLTELLYGAYYCIYNGLQVPGSQVVELIRQRASAQGCPSLLLTADAVRTVVLSNGPSQLPAASITTPSQIAKNMITNASFRAKKIGDDIPKVESEAAAAAAAAGATNADIDRHLRNLASMPITEEVLDELVEKKETPTHAGGAAKETAKEKGHVAKNIMEASKASKEKVIASKEKVIKAAGKAKMNIRKRIDSERDPERQNSRGQLIHFGKDRAERDGGGAEGVEMTLSEKKKERSERKKELHLQTSSPPAMMTAGASVVDAQGGPNGPKSSLAAAKKPSSLVDSGNVSNNGDVVYSGDNVAPPAPNSLEQVEALIKMKKLPAETVAIHSPESGTTLY